jgi:hypothetical protein
MAFQQSGGQPVERAVKRHAEWRRPDSNHSPSMSLREIHVISAHHAQLNIQPTSRSLDLIENSPEIAAPSLPESDRENDTQI